MKDRIKIKLAKIDERDNPKYFELSKDDFYQYFTEQTEIVRSSLILYGLARSTRGTRTLGDAFINFNQLERCLAFRGKPVFLKRK